MKVDDPNSPEVLEKLVEALGAKPVHIDYVEIGPKLKTGEIDASVLGVIPAKMFKLADGAAPYCTVMGGSR